MTEKIENYQKVKAFLDDAKLLAVLITHYISFVFIFWRNMVKPEREDKWSHHGIQKVLKDKNIIIKSNKLFKVLSEAYQLRVISDYRGGNANKDRVRLIISQFIILLEEYQP